MWKMAPLHFTVMFLLCFAMFSAMDASNVLEFATNDCFLTEPVYEHKFDFQSLHSDLARSITINDKGDTIEFNICGSITRTCDGKHNVEACLKRGSKEFVLGTQHELYYDNGKMYFKFKNGSKCDAGNGEFELRIDIGCDYTADKNQSKLISADANNGCVFHVLLETEQACLPLPDAVKSNDCNVKDDSSGYIYKLQPLSDANYRTKNPDGGEFVINICKPVLYDHNAMCPPGSSICFMDSNQVDYKKKFLDYGSAVAKPVIENHKLLMRHPTTTHCNANENYTSIVYFDCNLDETPFDCKNNAQNKVNFIGTKGCVHEFSFTTPLACGPCQIKSHSNEIIDLSSLKHKTFSLQQANKIFKVGVCSKLNGECDGEGACLAEVGKETNAVSLGRANSNLHLDESGTIYLLYENGAKCDEGSGHGNWSTKIELVCAEKPIKDGADASTMDTVLIENANCQVLLQIQTPVACHEAITCKSDRHDLTPLMSVGENYEAQIDRNTVTEQQVANSTKFLLNVCRPIVPKFGSGCHGAYAACITTVDSVAPRETKSLGLPTVNLISENDRTVNLRYFSGDVCASDSKTKLSTSIEFRCDVNAGQGHPILKNITDCQYIFDWPTKFACGTHSCSFNKDTCQMVNEEIKEQFSLKHAVIGDEGKIKFGQTRTLNLCDAQPKVVAKYLTNAVVLSFKTEVAEWCKNASTNVQMELNCSPNTKRTENFNDNDKCNLLIQQETPEICNFVGNPRSSASSSSSTSTTASATVTTSSTTAAPMANDIDKHPAEKTASIGTILAAILSLTFFVTCIGTLAFSPARRNAVRRLLRRGTSAVRYSRVRSNQEANLLLETNGEFTDTDDDMLL